MGFPKALLADDRGTPLTWVGAEHLHHAGCARVVVVLGAEAEQAQHLLALVGEVDTVVAHDWDDGLGASLRAGLEALADSPATVAAVLVTLVDLPDVDAAVMRRVLTTWEQTGGSPEGLVRATYRGRPGHPVLIGRSHWVDLCGTLRGDTGAQPYLSQRKVHLVPCEDLATGRDLDRPSDLAGPRPAEG